MPVVEVNGKGEIELAQQGAAELADQ
jgi:hypothetical protein